MLVLFLLLLTSSSSVCILIILFISHMSLYFVLTVMYLFYYNITVTCSRVVNFIQLVHSFRDLLTALTVITSLFLFYTYFIHLSVDYSCGITCV